MDYLYELEKMVCPSQLMNSYKLFFLKALFQVCESKQRECSFYELACRMCAASWSYVVKRGKRLRSLDKLYDIICKVISETDLYETSNQNEVLSMLIRLEDQNLRKDITALTNYVPYRLLSPKWQEQLNGIADREKNKIIEGLTQVEEYFYTIYGKKIIIDKQWSNFIHHNIGNLTEWIDEEIRKFVEE